MKKLCAVLAFAIVFTMSLPFLPAFASEVPDSAAALDSLMSNYGISGTDISGKTVTYCYGVNPSTGASQAALWIDNQGWKRVVSADGSVRFDGVYSYWFQWADSWCGHMYMAQFWYNTSDDYQLVSFSSSDAERVTAVYNNVSSSNVNYRDYTFVTSSGSTLGDYSADYAVQISPPETSTAAPSDGGFQLPSDWLEGETLASAEATDVGINEGEALAALESMNLDAVSDDSGLQSAFGAIWAMSSAVWSAFSVSGTIVACMLIMLLSWFFGRRL